MTFFHPAFGDALPAVPAEKGLAGAAPLASRPRTVWYYNWGLRKSTKGMPAVEKSVDFIPMCWCWKSGSAETLAPLRAERLRILFGFNKPDHTDQSNLTVQAALEAIPSLDGIADELVGPSCAQPAQSWMQEFMEKVERRDLRVGSVGFHHYGPPSPEGFISLLERVRSLLWPPHLGYGICRTGLAVQSGAAKPSYSLAGGGFHGSGLPVYGKSKLDSQLRLVSLGEVVSRVFRTFDFSHDSGRLLVDVDFATGPMGPVAKRSGDGHDLGQPVHLQIAFCTPLGCCHMS